MLLGRGSGSEVREAPRWRGWEKVPDFALLHPGYGVGCLFPPLAHRSTLARECRETTNARAHPAVDRHA